MEAVKEKWASKAEEMAAMATMIESLKDAVATKDAQLGGRSR